MDAYHIATVLKSLGKPSVTSIRELTIEPKNPKHHPNWCPYTEDIINDQFGDPGYEWTEEYAEPLEKKVGQLLVDFFGKEILSKVFFEVEEGGSIFVQIKREWGDGIRKVSLTDPDW